MVRPAQFLLIFLVSGLVTLGLLSSRLGNVPHRGGPASQVSTENADTAADATARLVATGHLREAQDEYLKILHHHAGDAGAMRGLVAVRRLLAGEDAAALRRQAAAYRQAIAAGAATPEHYSPDSMELLASASLQAVAAIEVEQSTTRPTEVAPPRAAPRSIPHRTASRSPSPDLRRTGAGKGPANPPAHVPSPPAPSDVPPAVAPQLLPAPAPPTTAVPGAINPASDQPAPAPAAPEETVAVVKPPDERPLAQSQGDIVSVDCQKRTFVIRGSNGDEEYLTAPTASIYVRGVQSQRVADVCGLQGYLGHTATVWSFANGDRRIARSVSVFL